MDQPDDAEEFARLPLAKTRRSLAAAILVVTLSVIVIWHLREDLRYALSSGTPQDASFTSFVDNTHARTAGTPDRRNALAIEPRGDKTRQTLFRLLGTGNRVFVWESSTTNRSDLDDRWSGRVRSLDALPYAAQIREYYATKTRARRFFAIDALRQGKGGSAVKDLSGESTILPPAQVIDIALSFTDGYFLSLAREKFPAPKDAQYELERLNVQGKFDHETKEDFVFLVTIPRDKRDAEMTRLEPLGINFAPHNVRIAAPLSSLDVVDGQLVYGPEKKTARLSEIVHLSIEAPIVIPADAWVLLEGQRPSDWSWTLAVAALLALFSLFNVWLLWRSASSTR